MHDPGKNNFALKLLPNQIDHLCLASFLPRFLWLMTAPVMMTENRLPSPSAA